VQVHRFSIVQPERFSSSGRTSLLVKYPPRKRPARAQIRRPRTRSTRCAAARRSAIGRAALSWSIKSAKTIASRCAGWRHRVHVRPADGREEGFAYAAELCPELLRGGDPVRRQDATRDAEWCTPLRNAWNGFATLNLGRLCMQSGPSVERELDKNRGKSVQLVELRLRNEETGSSVCLTWHYICWVRHA
jgi:hypothetical protein